jgi:hypothetical protein
MAVKKIILNLIVGYYLANSVSAQVRSYPANSLQETYMMLSNIHGINTERFYPQEYKSLKASWGFDTVVRNVDYLDLLPPIRNTKPHQYFTYAHPNFSLMPQYTPRFLRFLKPLGKNTILKTPAWFFSWMDNSSNKGSFFVVNPILHTEFSPKSPYTSRYLNNTKGIELFGQFSKNLSFSTQLLESQCYFQKYITQYQDTFSVTPNVGYWNKNMYGYSDFFRTRSNLYINLLKSKNNESNLLLSFGSDNQHYGSGYRSLLLSSFSPSTLYLRLNAKIGMLKYQNLIKELFITQKIENRELIIRKYLIMHSYNILLIKDKYNKNSIELGFSEMIIQFRDNNFIDLNYLNPITFLIPTQRDIGSPDNAFISFDIKFSKNKTIYYSQLILDEFSFNSLITGRSWANKFGVQSGVYIKPLPHINLIVNFEANIVRPYTFSHVSYKTNSTNYNQPIGHPLESNFREIVANLKYKPKIISGFLFTTNFFFAKKGNDPYLLGDNYGSNVRKDYSTAVLQNNVKILQGDISNLFHLKSQLYYEMMPNMWVYLAAQFRTQTGHLPSREYYTYLGLRWNWYEEQQLF